MASALAGFSVAGAWPVSGLVAPGFHCFVVLLGTAFDEMVCSGPSSVLIRGLGPSVSILDSPFPFLAFLGLKKPSLLPVLLCFFHVLVPPWLFFPAPSSPIFPSLADGRLCIF